MSRSWPRVHFIRDSRTPSAWAAVTKRTISFRNFNSPTLSPEFSAEYVGEGRIRQFRVLNILNIVSLQCMSSSFFLFRNVLNTLLPGLRRLPYLLIHRDLRGLLRSFHLPSLKRHGHPPVEPSHLQVHDNSNLNMLAESSSGCALYRPPAEIR